MKSIRTVALVGCILASAISYPFAAGSFSIPENTITFQDATYEGREVDIIGIKMGMSGDEALNILDEHRKGRNVNYLESNFGTRNVTSDYFKSAYYSWNRDAENITVLLTSPTSGGKVYSVARQIDFGVRDRPTMEDLTASLIKKYGEPSSEKTKNSSNKYLYWYLGESEKCSSPAKEGNICTSPLRVSWHTDINKIVYSPAKINSYKEQSSAGANTIIIAEITSFDDDGRVGELLVSIVEPKRAFATAEVDMKLIDEAEAQNSNRKVATPKL